MAGSSISVRAFDIGFRQTDLAADAGTIEVAYVNEGATLHRFVFDGLEDDFELEVAPDGGRDRGTIELEAGEYTFYCNVPGHRAAGVEGTLMVS